MVGNKIIFALLVYFNEITVIKGLQRIKHITVLSFYYNIVYCTVLVNYFQTFTISHRLPIKSGLKYLCLLSKTLHISSNFKNFIEIMLNSLFYYQIENTF